MIDAKIASTCAARTDCPAHISKVDEERALCSASCLRYSEIHAQLRISEIPARYLEIDGEPASVAKVADGLAKTDAAALTSLLQARWGTPDIVRLIEEGRGIYAHGPTGNGKTQTLAAIAADYIRRSVIASHVAGEVVRGQLVQFVDCYEFLEDAKLIFAKEDDVAARAARKIDALTQRMMNAKLVILDDIGAGKESATVVDRILRIVNYRLANEKALFLTSNLTLRQLEMAFKPFDESGRARSRIEGATMAVEFRGIDRRRKEAA